ncbi:P-loop containing nucleoside triphosphate hydrolase protein [Podospora conica]|nr:P-loop containing nucleoside triphosphate hydrolase protein [Schizothecium conicum]
MPSAASSSALQQAWLSSMAAGMSTGLMRSLLDLMRAAMPGTNSFSAALQKVSPTWDGASPVSAQTAQSDSPSANTNPLRFQLRSYQEECIQAVLSSFDQGHKRLGVSLATGSGKTVIFTQLIGRVKDISETASQTLILAHRRELVEQAARHCSNTYPDKTIELELGKHSASGTADITIASLQSITSRDRLLKFDPSRFKLLLVDEAHRIVSESYLKVLRHFGLDRKQPDSPHLVGVSATFTRHDGLRLGAAIDEIVYHKDYIDMISEKWLSNVVFTTVDTMVDLSQVRRNGQGEKADLDVSQLSKKINTEEINDITIRSWLAKAADRKSTLVFCVDLSHVAAITEKFRQYGIDARYVTGDTPNSERSERLEAFKRGEFPVLVNCSIFTEGTDIPNIDCVLLARPTQSRGLLTQMMGRGMRLHPGKEDCLIIDMVSSLDTGIVSTPTLFGLDPGEIVDGLNSDEMFELKEAREKERKGRPGIQQPESTGNEYQVMFTEYDSVFDLISDTSTEKHIWAVSKFSWVAVDRDRFILAGPDGSFIRLEKTTDQESLQPVYKAYEVRALPAGVAKTPYAAPREILSVPTFVDAVHGSDNYAKEKFPYGFIYRNAQWRKGEASLEQLRFLKIAPRRDEKPVRKKGDEKPVRTTTITKGAAMDMITKIKHGARGRFAKLKVENNKAKKSILALEGEQARRSSQAIAVGPVLS